ncbi:MAG: hypothetical protein GKS06_14570 [Acidobacteria bacterium]|nr:hypothetical protein [Acidobacteriota bacterium]
MRYTAEAEKIRWTYLAELEARLAETSPDERLAMVEEIRDHLDDAARELESELIDGPNMTDLIRRVGNVEALAISVDDETPPAETAKPSTVPTEGSKAFTAQWEGEYEGHMIRVVNKWNLLLFGSGLLYVDDELVAEDTGWMNTVSILMGTIRKDGGDKSRLRARLAAEQEEGSFFDRLQSRGVVCRVWIDGEPLPMELIEG